MGVHQGSLWPLEKSHTTTTVDTEDMTLSMIPRRRQRLCSFSMGMLSLPLLLLGLFLLLTTVTAVRAESSTCLADGTCSDGNEDDELTEDDDADCVDSNDSCQYWASIGECDKNPNYMLGNCELSCDSCGYMKRQRARMMKRSYKSEEERKLNERMQNLGRDENGIEQDLDMDNYQEEIEQVLEEMEEYKQEIVEGDDEDMKEVLAICKNNNPSCVTWASAGECENNPAYMRFQCPLVCQKCDQLSVKTRCPLDPDTPNAWKPGSLNEFFTNITTSDQYETTILSGPGSGSNDDDDGPWVVTIPDFLSDTECDHLVQLGHNEGYQRSADVGDIKKDGTYDALVNEGRTSTNAWCQHSCYQDPIAQQIIGRIAELTNTPETNSEHLQILRYEPGQYYNTHHDYIEHLRDRQQGARLLTVFLYLNDVEEGGGTNFPQLDLTVQPKKGMALVWPSVLDESPDDKDPRTEHGALPVEKGIKYGANAWIHQRDFKGPNGMGCQ